MNQDRFFTALLLCFGIYLLFDIMVFSPAREREQQAQQVQQPQDRAPTEPDQPGPQGQTPAAEQGQAPPGGQDAAIDQPSTPEAQAPVAGNPAEQAPGEAAAPSGPPATDESEIPAAAVPEVAGYLAAQAGANAGAELQWPTGVFDGRWTAKGGGLRSLTLKGFKATGSESPLVLLPEVPGAAPHLALRDISARTPIEDRTWRLERLAKGGMAYETIFNTGVVARVEVEAPDQAYHFDLNVTLENRRDVPANQDYVIYGPVGIDPEVSRGYEVQGLVATKNDAGGLDLIYLSPGKVKDGYYSQRLDRLAWVGATNQYFASVIAPVAVEGAPDVKARVEYIQLGADKPPTIAAALEVRGLRLAAGQKKTHTFRVFAGPKDSEVLAAYKDERLPMLIDYGWFGMVSVVCLWVLRSIHALIPDWGLAIIVLTLIVRAAIHPLSVKTYKSMLAQQKIAPQLQALKDKYKGKKSPELMKKMQEETMALYREHGVNPIGGCLPMVLQLPIFIGLYKALSYTFELRQAPFHFTWIRDLSQPDCILHLGGPIPLLGTNCVNVLPVIMGVLMFVQQSMTPKSEDPQQAQMQSMMKYFMLFMVFLFYSIPSGLVVYFLTSTLVGLGEQRWIKHRFGRAPVPAATAPVKG